MLVNCVSKLAGKIYIIIFFHNNSEGVGICGRGREGLDCSNDVQH